MKDRGLKAVIDLNLTRRFLCNPGLRARSNASRPAAADININLGGRLTV